MDHHVKITRKVVVQFRIILHRVSAFRANAHFARYPLYLERENIGQVWSPLAAKVTKRIIGQQSDGQ